MCEISYIVTNIRIITIYPRADILTHYHLKLFTQRILGENIIIYFTKAV